MTPDGALGDRLSVGDVASWLNAYVFHAESAFYLGRVLASTVRDDILRRLSGRGSARIHVSGMSDGWLRMHETDFGKHRVDV